MAQKHNRAGKSVPMYKNQGLGVGNYQNRQSHSDDKPSVKEVVAKASPLAAGASAAIFTPGGPILKAAAGVAVVVIAATIALSAHFIHKKIENNKQDNIIYTEIPQQEHSPSYDPHRDVRYP